MADTRGLPHLSDRVGRISAIILTMGAVAAVVAILHGPVVDLALTGDSYQWIQHAHAAAHDPGLLFADLDTFLRPSTTWSLVADRMVWGGFNARGYRTSSLILHGLAAFALACAARRLGLRPAAAAIVALLWVTSPFTDESAFVVAYRFQPLLLLGWLVLIVTWPDHDQRWSRGRVAAAALAVVAAAAAKETWVVTPALVAALEFDRRQHLRNAMRPVLTVGAAVAAYVLVYFIFFPGSKSYFVLGMHPAAKIPTQLAAFFYLREPISFAVTLSWQGVLASAAFVAMVVSCIRWKVVGSWTAVALFILPTLPTLLVPYMPQRYLAIPYAGFLLLVALWVSAAVQRMPRWRWAIRGGAVAVALAVIAAGSVTVRTDLADYRRMAAAHDALLTETLPFAGAIADGGTVAVVRDERTQPLVEILREPRGFAKLPYTRHSDPYGLIDTAALFEWVVADEGTRIESVPDWPDRCRGIEGEVLIHTDGGFIDRGRVPDLAFEALRWRQAGRHVQVIRAESKKPAGGTGGRS